MNQPPAIELTDVVKTFGDLRAVDGLTLTVPRGVCLGLLGPNGAGKSTTMRMLTGQARPTSGQIRVLGFDLPAQAKRARAQMGIVPQEERLDDQLTPRENVTVWAHLLRVPRRHRTEAVDRALAVARLSDRADDRIKTLSGGMKRRLLFARALVHNPRLVLLDEPTVGLDPQVRQEMWAIIDDLRNTGTTVLMSTHYIEEAERLADSVAVVNAGRVIASGTPLSLLEEHAGNEALEFYGPASALADIERIIAPTGLPTRRSGPAVTVLRAESLPAEVAAQLPDGVRRGPTLEDVFVLLTGETLQ